VLPVVTSLNDLLKTEVILVRNTEVDQAGFRGAEETKWSPACAGLTVPLVGLSCRKTVLMSLVWFQWATGHLYLLSRAMQEANPRKKKARTWPSAP